MTAAPERAAEASLTPALEWVWNPWRESPGRAALALGFALFAWAVAWAITRSASAALALALASAGILRSWLVPQKVRLDETGVAVRGLLGWEARPWRQVRRAVTRPAGVWVSPFLTPRRLDRFRALFLPLPRAERAQLAGALRAHFERHGV